MNKKIMSSQPKGERLNKLLLPVLGLFCMGI
jgi:hypothetical protein